MSNLELERLALRAWPAEEERELGGWRLRAMRGVTRRANSVWTAYDDGSMAPERKITEAERFYAERGLDVRFQVSTASAPTDLEPQLAERGYVSEAPVSVQSTEAVGLLACLAGVAHGRVERDVFETWFEVSGTGGRFRGVEQIYRGLLARLRGRGLYALAEAGKDPASVVLGVLDGDHCGIFSMLTLPAYRGRGFGTIALAALVRAASARGARTFYLQVERDNPAAIALYAKLGFEERYGYSYRLRAAPH
ncbi:MAG TPA: GNAT family N-acetyltransferase [Polyangiaceae bacterium]